MNSYRSVLFVIALALRTICVCFYLNRWTSIITVVQQCLDSILDKQCIVKQQIKYQRSPTVAFQLNLSK